jgi:putative superfamily III holin-X
MPQGREERPIGALFSDLARETSALVRTEVQLAKTEIIERAGQFASGLVMLIAGGLLLYAALLVLLFAAALGLGQAFDWWATMPWLPPLIVGVVVALIGVALLLKGKGDVRPRNLVPRRTVATIKEDAAWAREKVR